MAQEEKEMDNRLEGEPSLSIHSNHEFLMLTHASHEGTSGGNKKSTTDRSIAVDFVLELLVVQ